MTGRERGFLDSELVFEEVMSSIKKDRELAGKLGCRSLGKFLSDLLGWDRLPCIGFWTDFVGFFSGTVHCFLFGYRGKQTDFAREIPAWNPAPMK